MFGSSLLGSNGGITAPLDLSQGLLAHYLLNNNADDSFGTYDGTPSAGVDFQSDTVAFDATNPPEYIDNATFTRNNTQITVLSMWVTIEADNASTETYGIFAGSVNSDRMYLGYNRTTDTLGFGYGNKQNVTADTGIPLVYNTLFHIVAIFNNGIFTVYKDRAQVFTDTYTPTLYSHHISCIGTYWHITNGYSFNFNPKSKISNFRIYNEAKDQTFIDALYAEGYYPKPLPLPTTVGLLAHYPLTGTAEDITGNYDSTEVSATYVDDAEYGSVFSGTGSITVNTTATGLATWCCYWVDSGAGWVFTKTTTIPSSLTSNKYRNLRLYSLTPSTTLQDEIEEYEKNFRPIDIDDGLVAYYPLENNSLDNYKNQYDGTDSAGVTYGGTQATIPTGDSITFPTATGFVEAYYTLNGVVTKTTTESTLNALDNCTLKDVRKYNQALSAERQSIIGYTP